MSRFRSIKAPSAVSATFIVMLMSVAACAVPHAVRDTKQNPAPAGQAGVPVAQSGVSNLPYSRGQSFSNLDAYLAHLKVMGTMDVPYYHEIGPGRYKLESGRGTRDMPPVYATRAELMRKFGFTR